MAGCSRGYVSKHIAPECVEELILCDTSKYNLDAAPVNAGIKVRKQILDEENIQVSYKYFLVCLLGFPVACQIEVMYMSNFDRSVTVT